MRQPVNTFFDTRDAPDLAKQLNDVVRRANGQLNDLTEGRLSSLHSAQVAPPTQGPYAVGDFVPNAARGVPLGTVGSEYLLWGWTCTAATEPPAWAELRFPLVAVP